jgi:predicted molibdopterin-dependent oxidoreductase YjgC
VFRRIYEPGQTLSFSFDGRLLRAAPGDSVAAALLQAGVDRFRTSVVGGEPRGPHCMMGVCFDCLVTIDGVPNRQSCQVQAAEGMVVESQHGPRAIGGKEA